jgi:hypothetical protein
MALTSITTSQLPNARLQRTDPLTVSHQAVAGTPAAFGFAATEVERSFIAMPAAISAISALP